MGHIQDLNIGHVDPLSQSNITSKQNDQKYVYGEEEDDDYAEIDN